MARKDKEKDKAYQAEYYLAHREEKRDAKNAHQREYDKKVRSSKNEYMKNVYTQLIIRLKKDEAEEYKRKCTEMGIPFSEIPKIAIQKFLNGEWPNGDI